MNYPPKLVAPLCMCLTVGALILPYLVFALPTIPQALHANLIHNVDKSFLQPPTLEETIHGVQQILNQDPTLPKLTRGEVEELYEKVTKEEYDKSIRAGDKVRADSMRALMLVLPYNTDNNTEENLQELFTRPPVTKVVDSYSSHQPIQFLTPSMNSEGKVNTKAVGEVDVTTYKPSFRMKAQTKPLNPTTYHPSNPPPVLQRMTSVANKPNFASFKPIVTDLPLNYDYNPKPVQRFSSHYSAKNPEFFKFASNKKKYQSPAISTAKPIADVLESLGIVAGHTPTRSRWDMDDYYTAESAPKPSIISVADLKGLNSQRMGPQINPDAYSMFRPLNIGEEIRVKPEVETYLTRFGIMGNRKRKAIKKSTSSSTQNSLEPLSQESEIATSKIPSNHVKAKKGAPSLGNAELEKLLENLKELERLNVDPKTVVTTRRPTTTTTTTTTTSTTAPAPVPAPEPTSAAPLSLITNGKPMLVEPKKPRRRIDPHIDINVANQGNHQTEFNSSHELSKLLENLQELEKLKINPEIVLQTASSFNKGSNQAASRNVAVVTPAPIQASALSNRFTAQQYLTPQQQLLQFQQQAQSGATTPDLDQLQKVLQQLQIYEKVNTKTGITTTTTTTTTKRPVNLQSQIGPTDFWQLRKLLTDDKELEKLFQQAKARQQQQEVKTKPTTTTTTTTSTTKKPTTSITDLLQLQKYLAELEKTTPRATSTTTTTTTFRPPIIYQYPTIDYDAKPKKQTVENSELLALINRVQQLERLTFQQKELENSRTTDTPLSPFLGFTTHNVKTSLPKVEDIRLPVNDFANLRSLYRQVEEAEKVSHSNIEISTKATANKAYQEQQLETATRKAQNFAQRIIDITNDTGSGSSLQEVDSNDFVQLQKLLSKVQELERVRINIPTPNPRTKETTRSPYLDAAASQRTQNVKNINGAHIVYPTKVETYKEVEDIIQKDEEIKDLNLDLPAYKKPTKQPFDEAIQTKDLILNDELKDLVYVQPSLEETAYKNLQTPMIHKTVTKEPPRFVATKKLNEIKQMNKEKSDLKEIQKLLNNAQELKKLGVSLPADLATQLEEKFSQPDTSTDSKIPSSTESMFIKKKETSGLDEYLQGFGLTDNTNGASQSDNNVVGVFAPTTASSGEELGEKTAVFSLTTMKSLTARPSKTTTESSVQLPIFSATKIIEAAIKRAANRIGVSTEGTKDFHRRMDVNVDETKDDMETGVAEEFDLMADISEINYQLALPDEEPLSYTRIRELKGDYSKIDNKTVLPDTKSKKGKSVEDLTANADELQRLIKNLQELKNLNLSPSDKALLRQTDLKYLENLKKQQTAADDTIKTRRQSDKPREGTITNTESNIETSAPTTTTTTTTESSRIQLNLNLDDSDINNSDTATTTTTDEPRNGSLADLEDSFGPNPITESPPPPKKKNGFYFLADWNSFLEVGDGDDQVVVRLSPKIGDPRLFLPVKIP